MAASKDPLEARLDLAKELSRRAGAVIWRNLGRAKRVSHKGRIDLLTEFDLQSEQIIVEGLQAAFPQDSILAEEQGRVGQDSTHWVIDPIDGTTNFAHGIPEFSVCIAYVEGCVPLLGVTYDPSRDELFSARRGAGAQLNGQPIHVTETKDLASSLLATGFPYHFKDAVDDNFGHWEDLFHESLGVRHLGCASLNPAYVAAGRLDGYWELHARPWDLAPGVLLVEEAGGTVTRADGSEEVLRDPCSILATNGHLHEAILEHLLA